MLVYDVTDELSFESLTMWMGMVKENADENTEIILLGNKSDMLNNIAVSQEKVEKFCSEHNIKYYKVSAKEDSIDTAVVELVTNIISNESLSDKIKPGIELENPKYVKKSTCC